MRKIFVFFLIFISSQLFAQKEIIGSWKSKDTFNYYGVETFFANGNYRIDLFKKEGDYWMHMGFPDSGKWTLDSDGVLCTYGTQSVSTAFVKLDVFEDESLTAADIKRLKEAFKDYKIKYIVLLVTEETLLERDKLRPEDCRMNERCLVLLNNFLKANIDEKYKLYTDNKTVEETVDYIENNNRFIVGE